MSVEKKPKNLITIQKIAQTAIMAAVCFVTFTFLQIKIPTPAGGMTSLHIANAFLVLASLYLGGMYGGLAGAIGMGIADVLDPIYIVEAPLTFVLKLTIGLVVGLVAHRIGKINESTDKDHIFKWTLLATVAGLGYNVIMNPVLGYFYKWIILGQPQNAAVIFTGWTAIATFVNAVVSTILVMFIYMGTRPILRRLNMI
ncbi:MAG: ECF transporter S component [Lachnospiraceae bacterium]|jgi:uncharacterized membrane protein|nr:ECF transporter S component [Lachnospiraceae bacterium]